MDKKQLSLRAADNIRILALSMVEKAKSGHPGGAMGGADFAQVLFGEYMVFDPECPEWFARDRFFLDPGHMSPMLYATLSMHGKYSMEDLKNFRQWESVTPGHPERDVRRGVENTSGPLGQGHTYAVGAAIAAKKMEAKFGKIMRQRIFAFISDGGVQEEISQGAGRIAGHLGLDNLVIFYDANNIQLSTTVDEVTSEDVAMKYKAWGWEVIEINGNDHEQIRKALDKAIAVKGKPTLIIGKTLMGKGAMDADGKSFENKVSTHGQPLSAAGACTATSIKGMGGNPDNPFVIFDDVKKMYADRQKALKEECKVGERSIRLGEKLMRLLPTSWIPGCRTKLQKWTGRVSYRSLTKRHVQPRQQSLVTWLSKCPIWWYQVPISQTLTRLTDSSNTHPSSHVTTLAGASSKPV